ncbi:MAG: amidohydrolase family protein [Verrucomicrobiota bacterium]|jgi:hypothetical protein|nr:amidohydrolase family protein [Verrucomicrobiota bacterium]
MSAILRAEVAENFDAIDDPSYGTESDYGAWRSYNAMVATNNARSGKCLVFNRNEGPYLLYRGTDGQGKTGGLGTVSVWYRHWNGDSGKTVQFLAEYSQNNGGTWTQIGSPLQAGSITYGLFTADANVAGDNILVRFRSVSHAERLCLDDVTLGDFDGVVEDPNLVAPTRLSFGTLDPGSAATQTLSIANSGATQPLRLYSISPYSGDTGRFDVGALPVSTLAPGQSTSLSIVYRPGPETGATHAAVWRLNTDDPGTPAYTITLRGQTIGAGIAISNVQYTTASSGASPLTGSRVSVKGIATYADPSGYALSDPDGGPWSGVYVADVNHRPNPGDLVCLDGRVEENSGMTQLADVQNYFLLSIHHPVPVTPLRSSQLAEEAHEGVFARIDQATVRNVNLNDQNAYWQAADSAGTFRVASCVPLRYIWTLDETFDAIQGLVYTAEGTPALSPRFDADLIGRNVLEYALRGLVMTPDGALTNGIVHVKDDVIQAVTTAPPVGVPLVETGGILFPGLIDVHNHPGYNSFPTLMFNNFPFGHRDQWGESDEEYTAWKNARTSLRNHTAVKDSATDIITKYGECLELMAGCIAIQGQSNTDPEHSHPAVILRNLEQFPSRVWCNIFPWDTSAGARSALREKIDGGAITSTLIHLAEGTDTVARAQFDTWRDWGMLDHTTAIIHGAALTASQFQQMAAVGAKLIWSPMSNMKLYADTADVRAAKEAGVLIGLSPDWTPSGCYNILEELGYAWKLNQTRLNSLFTPKELCDMVTLNNAICAGLGETHGQIAPGRNAGLVVIEGDPEDPYLSLIAARPKHVLLTVVDGTPRYGDATLMDALGIPGDTQVDVHGRAKRFNIAVNHPFLEYSCHTFAQLTNALHTGHASLSPNGQLDREELQLLDVALLQGNGDDVPPFRADSPLSGAPATMVTYDRGSNLSLTFRYQDFWDNETFVTNLRHTISIVPARHPQFPLQTIAANLSNTPANQQVPFTVNFIDMHTNYTFVFETTDDSGNVRRSVMTNTFRLAYHAEGDTDRDGIPNEWAIRYYGTFSGVDAAANDDEDELANLQEYIAGTDPWDAASTFAQMGPVTAQGPGVLQLESPSASFPDRMYDVWFTTNLTGRVAWTPLGMGRRGTGGTLAFTVTNQWPYAAYRIGVRLP